MAFIIGLLTVILVLDCAVLILLVLIQLPKKDAGAGVAFGAAATDALFGAGSGNMLTKITKYAAGTFFVLAIGLGLLQSAFNKRSVTDFQEELEKQAKESAAAVTPAPVQPVAAPASNLITVPAPTTPSGTNPAAE